jgi:hypothetical protein
VAPGEFVVRDPAVRRSGSTVFNSLLWVVISHFCLDALADKI